MKTLRILFIFVLSSSLFACSEKHIADVDSIQSQNEREFINLKSGKVLERIGDNYFFEGDIAVSNAQLEALQNTGNILDAEGYDYSSLPPTSPKSGISILLPEQQSQLKALGLSPSQNRFWSMVRYVFAKDISNRSKQKVFEAIAHIEQNTNVRFYNATNQPTRDPVYNFDYPYIEIDDNRDKKNSNDLYLSWSRLGRIGGMQELKIAYFASVGTVMHEMCHALGLMHEQNRYDRDNYITIHSENISPEGKSQFAKETNNYYYIGDFDFKSIMLYDSYSFSKNGQPTMTKKDGSIFYANRVALSEFDKRFLNTFYLPYKARTDICTELDKIVYKSDNSIMSEPERIKLERQLNRNRCSYPLRK